MSAPLQIELLPLGRKFSLARGTALQDFLFLQGVEFPCGGLGRCRGCKVKLLQGELPVTEEETQKLSPAERAEGWRLACRHRAVTDLRIELAQWEAPILSDDSVFAFTPQEGLGVAVDLGTTTLVAQLLDLRTGHVLGVRTALNPQARFGADIMSRIQYALSGKRELLVIRKKIGAMIAELLTGAAADATRLRRVVIVGNTVMHHLFCDLDVTPLSRQPFESPHIGLQTLRPDELGWQFASGIPVLFLPGLGSFVGSDILAGLLATRLHERDSLAALIDLGTNGEIVVGNRERLVCASTAAGPAFEGARISMGMRAATGAISEVSVRDGTFHCHTLGNVAPRGICGSGLVDAVAGGLDLGLIQPSGRLATGKSLALEPPVSLSQADIRELQLAKGAIAAGIRMLTEGWGARLADLSQIFLAGAFGNYINCTSAKRIGLLNFPREKVQSVGNSALLGAKLALFHADGEPDYESVRKKIKHVSLNEDTQFQEIFAEEMGFPIDITSDCSQEKSRANESHT